MGRERTDTYLYYILIVAKHVAGLFILYLNRCEAFDRLVLSHDI